MKILIAADGSDYTRRMLGYFAAHDELLGPQHTYTVLHCVLAIPHRAAAFVGRAQVRDFYESDAEAVFKPIRAFFAMQGMNATFVHRIGSPAETLAKLAERGEFDLVIMGTHGHGAAGGLVMGARGVGAMRAALPGSVSHGVLHGSKLPVTMVKQ